MPIAEVNIEIYCAGCGAGLCGDTEFVQTRNRNEPSFRVSPCKVCLETAREEGRIEGREENQEE